MKRISRIFFALFLISFVLIIGGHFIRMIVYPPFYKHGFWGEPANFRAHIFYFCTHAEPNDYKMVTFRFNPRDQNALALYENVKTNQFIFLIRYREHELVDLSSIAASANYPRSTAFYENASIHPKIRIPYYLPNYWVPWLIREDVRKSPSKLLIEGLKLSSESILETDVAKIRIFEGSFSRLAFKRPGGILRKYAIPAIDFADPQHGMVAAIQSKANGKTIFLVSSSQEGSLFERQPVIDLLESLTFETKIPEDPFKKKGWKPIYTEERTSGPIKTKVVTEL